MIAFELSDLNCVSGSTDAYSMTCPSDLTCSRRFTLRDHSSFIASGSTLYARLMCGILGNCKLFQGGRTLGMQTSPKCSYYA